MKFLIILGSTAAVVVCAFLIFLRAQATNRERASARDAHRKEQDQVEQDLWKRASDTSGATSLEDLGVLTIAYLEHFPDGQHAQAARKMRDQAIERLWMNRVLDLVDHWRQLYNQIRENQEVIDRALRSPDAWMHQRKLEELAQFNVAYQKKLGEVSAALDAIGAGGFSVAMPTENLDAITAFCRQNRDAMRFQRWQNSWVEEALPKAKQVRLGSAEQKIGTEEEATE